MKIHLNLKEWDVLAQRESEKWHLSIFNPFVLRFAGLGARFHELETLLVLLHAAVVSRITLEITSAWFKRMKV